LALLLGPVLQIENVLCQPAGSAGARLLLAAALLGFASVAMLILLVDPEAAQCTNSSVTSPLKEAASNGHTATCQLLLDVGPEAATAAGGGVWVPLHLASLNGHSATCQLLLDRAPASATAAGDKGQLPLHLAAMAGHTAVCQLLLDAALDTATAADDRRFLPLHYAAQQGHTATCQLLVDRAPEAASFTQWQGRTPLQLALNPIRGPPLFDTARCLLAFGPATSVLTALLSRPAALPLFADFVIARPTLTSEEWAAVPTPCPGLCKALPAVLARSTDQARHLVQHLPPADAQRLRTAALSLHRAQTAVHVTALPASVVWSILALSFTD
jgi:ankyrin repeat protein